MPVQFAILAVFSRRPLPVPSIGVKRVGVHSMIGKNGNGQGVPPGFLRPIDTDRIARELRIDERAAENGRRELPTAEAQVMDSVERDIVQKIEGEWAWQAGELINVVRAYSSRLLGFSIDSEFARLKIEAHNSLTALRALNMRAPADLGPLQDGYLAARAELDRFREGHTLQRPARNPSNRWTAFGLLVVLVAFESLLNGIFFAKGAKFGLIGGVGTAIGISLANMIFAFLLGLVPARYINHQNFVLKAFGLLVTLAGVAALIALHAFAAHLREATALVGESAAMKHALETLLRSPWSATEIETYYLFALGVMFALAALYKGYTFDDPYPGYGATSRRAIDAREAYSDEHAELFDGLGDVRESTIKDLQAGIVRIPLLPQEADNIRVQRDATLKKFRTYETTIVGSCNQLLARYRQSNQSHRSSRVPAHFDSDWSIPNSAVDGNDVRQLLAEAVREPPDVSSMLAELDQLSRSLLSEYESLMTRFPHPTQMD